MNPYQHNEPNAKQLGRDAAKVCRLSVGGGCVRDRESERERERVREK